MEGSAVPTPRPARPEPSGQRASDAERDEVAARLRDEFTAGRLSHETFVHRMGMAFEAKRRGDLSPLVADLPEPPARPPAPPPAAAVLEGWLRGVWRRLARPAAQPGPGQADQAWVPGPGRAVTTGMLAASGGAEPLALRFPRGSGAEFSIGRDASCDLAIADMTVSRRHATLERTPDGWLLTDLGSTNGTRVNGWRVRGKVLVMAGDLVSFGNAQAVFARPDGPGELTALRAAPAGGAAPGPVQ